MTPGISVGREASVDFGLEFAGTVVRGDARGRLLGFPTANLDPCAGSRAPPDGVWVAEVQGPQLGGPGCSEPARRPIGRDQSHLRRK